MQPFHNLFLNFIISVQICEKVFYFILENLSVEVVSGKLRDKSENGFGGIALKACVLSGNQWIAHSVGGML